MKNNCIPKTPKMKFERSPLKLSFKSWLQILDEIPDHVNPLDTWIGHDNEVELSWSKTRRYVIFTLLTRWPRAVIGCDVNQHVMHDVMGYVLQLLMRLNLLSHKPRPAGRIRINSWRSMQGASAEDKFRAAAVPAGAQPSLDFLVSLISLVVNLQISGDNAYAQRTDGQMERQIVVELLGHSGVRFRETHKTRSIGWLSVDVRLPSARASA